MSKHTRHRRKPNRDTCPKCGKENIAYTLYPYDYPIEWARGQKNFYWHKDANGKECKGE